MARSIASKKADPPSVAARYAGLPPEKYATDAASRRAASSGRPASSRVLSAPTPAVELRVGHQPLVEQVEVLLAPGEFGPGGQIGWDVAEAADRERHRGARLEVRPLLDPRRQVAGERSVVGDPLRVRPPAVREQR